MIEWAQENGTIDPSTFFEENWSVSTPAAEGGAEELTETPTNGEGSNLAKTGSSDIFALAGAALAMLIAGSVLVVRRMKA